MTNNSETIINNFDLSNSHDIKNFILIDKNYKIKLLNNTIRPHGLDNLIEIT